MNEHLISLWSCVRLPPANGQGVGHGLVARLNAEAGTLGYTFQKGLHDGLAALDRATFETVRNELIVLLSNLSGASSRHRTLFRKFPYEGPENLDFLWNWILGARHRFPGVSFSPTGLLVLDRNGMIIDLELAGRRMERLAEGVERVPFAFNHGFDEQWDGLHDHDEIRHAYAWLTPLKPLFLADDALLSRKTHDLLARQGSLSEAERIVLRRMPRAFGVAALADIVASGAKIHREQLPLAYTFSDDLQTFSSLLSGTTDVLRIASFLSDAAADPSLKESVKFKLSKQHNRDLLFLLESCKTLEEDLLRHRERWLRFGEIANPGSRRNAARYPRVAAAFAKLRNHPKDIATFARTVEHGLRSRVMDSRFLETLSSRPGEFARRLDWLLRTASEPATVLEAFAYAAHGVPTQTLFGLRKFFEFRATAPGRDRVFVPKGPDTRMKVLPDRRAPVAPAILSAVQDVIAEELQRRFRDLPFLGRVWLDPLLRDVILPFNRRGDSATNVAMSKGTRYDMGQGDVIRLFVHWKGKDVDLSAILLDGDFRTQGHVAFTNLRTFSCIHSGDVRSAPKGASEFIDFDVSDLRSRGIRYVVASLISFHGGAFKDFPCFAGFMERDSLKSGKKFEPQSVRVKFDLVADTTSMLPLIFDLESRKVIFADISSGGRSGETAIDSVGRLAQQARAVVEMPLTRTTAWDVLYQHALARGTLAESMEESDVAWMAANIDLEWLLGLASSPAP